MENKNPNVSEQGIFKPQTETDKLSSSSEVNSLVENFFRKLNSEVTWEGEKLIVKNVPKLFENFYGKKSPYYVVFNPEDYKEEYELATKESFLIKTIAEFLDNKGKLTSLKINEDIDISSVINKNLKFKNAEIIKTNKNTYYKNIFRYTFLTTLQYLNENEKIINYFYAFEGKLINFDLEKFKTEDFKKSDFSQDEIKTNYEIVKNELKLVLRDRIDKAGSKVKKQLDLETQRIEDHYRKLNEEKLNEIRKNEAQIKILEKKNKNPNVSEQGIFKPQTESNGKLSLSNKTEGLGKLEKIKENIEKIKIDFLKDTEQFSKEKSALIKDEIQKHSLNINNSLMNTTIMSLPFYKFQIYLKSTKGNLRYLDLDYNLLDDKISLKCEESKKEGEEFYLCAGGQLCLQESIKKCSNCDSFVCLSGEKIVSEISGREICKNCSLKCPECKKVVSINQSEEDSLKKNKLCFNCLKSCALCNKKTIKINFKSCGICKREVCKNCIKRKLIEKTPREVCSGCYSKN